MSVKRKMIPLIGGCLALALLAGCSGESAPAAAPAERGSTSSEFDALVAAATVRLGRADTVDLDKVSA